MKKAKNPVGRPKRCRRVSYKPSITHFKPAGIPLSTLEEIHLTIDEIEAIRLADFEGHYQDSAAKKMNISRQTFGRILVEAHKKIAEALVLGKSILIKGVEYTASPMRVFQCEDCDHIWELPLGTGKPDGCPSCRNKCFNRKDNHSGHHPNFHSKGKNRRVRATHTGESS